MPISTFWKGTTQWQLLQLFFWEYIQIFYIVNNVLYIFEYYSFLNIILLPLSTFSLQVYLSASPPSVWWPLPLKDTVPFATRWSPEHGRPVLMPTRSSLPHGHYLWVSWCPILCLVYWCHSTSQTTSRLTCAGLTGPSARWNRVGESFGYITCILMMHTFLMFQKENHALRAGGENFLNLKIRVNLTYFVFWETYNYSSVASEGQY